MQVDITGAVKLLRTVCTNNSCALFTGTYFFVMEFHGGHLRSQLEVLKRFNEPAAEFYAAEINLALHFIHTKGIVHREENFILSYASH
jgi:serine/threonine protein kinase